MKMDKASPPRSARRRNRQGRGEKDMPRAKARWPRARGPRVDRALLGVLGLALVIRAIGVMSGLPDFMDEAVPLRLALAMRQPVTGAIDWNPHAFNYPSLSVYLHFMVQNAVYGVGRLVGVYTTWPDYLVAFWHDPSPMVIAARSLEIACDVLGILGIVRLGERMQPKAGLLAGTLMALMPALILTSRAVYCDTIMLAASIWAMERMVAWHRSGRTRDLTWAAVLIGLAAGSKYPALVLFAPLVLLVLHRRQPGRARRIVVAAAIVAGIFFVTTPFALLDSTSFLRDFAFEGAHAQTGHFGSLEHLSFLYHVSNLARNIGWVGLAALVVSAGQMLVDHRDRVERASLWLVVLGFGLPISFARIDAERYVLPVAAVSALLVSITVVAAGRLIASRAGAVKSGWMRRAEMALPAAILLVQPTWLGVETAFGGSDSTRVEAKHWLSRHMTPEQLLVQEAYCAPLLSILQVVAYSSNPTFLAASPRTQHAILQTQPLYVFDVPLAVSGNLVANFTDAEGRPAHLQAFAKASDLNAAFYDARLYADADFIMTSSAIRGRYEADPVRYPAQVEFYRALDRLADRAVRFDSHGRVTGPDLVVYRCTDRWRSFALSRPDDPLAWTHLLPATYRESAEKLMTGLATSDTGARADPRASRTEWLGSLRDLFRDRLGAHFYDLATEYAGLKRFASAVRCAQIITTTCPDDVGAALLASVSRRRMGRSADAKAGLEEEFRAGLPKAGAVQFEYARALLAERDSGRARDELDSLVAQAGSSDAVAEMASDLLHQMGKGDASQARRR